MEWRWTKTENWKQRVLLMNWNKVFNTMQDSIDVLANTCYVVSCETKIDNIVEAVKQFWIKIYLVDENDGFFFR